MYSYRFYYKEDGKNYAYIRLRAAKQQLLGRVKGNKTTVNTKVLEERLTKLFYPPANDIDAQNISVQFNQMLQNVFEELSQKKFFEKNFNVGQGKFHQQNHPPAIVGSTTVTAIKNLISRIEANMNILTKAQDINLINKTLNSLDMNFQQALNTIQQALLEMQTAGVKSVSFSSNLSSKNASIGQAYNYLKALEVVCQPGHAFTKKDLGDILEFALGLLENDLNYTVDAVKEEVVEKVKQQVKGSTTAARAAQGLSMDMYLTDAKISGILGQQVVPNSTYQIGDMVIKRQSSINPGSAKYGKIDVYKNQDMRISAKNWSSLTFTNFKTNTQHMRNIGGAKLLDALVRTTNILDDYIWLFQDEKASSYYSLAHSVAKLSAYTDIALGFGNKTSANVLVINLREARRVYVIDMNQEILNAIQNKKSKFVLANYNEAGIEKAAQYLSKAATKRQYQRHGSSLIYQTLMYDYLAGQRVVVEMSPTLQT